MNDIPLVRTNNIDDINTSLIAVKKTIGEKGDIREVNVDVSVHTDAVDEVTLGEMSPVTSNAVSVALSAEVSNRNSAIANAIGNLVAGTITTGINGVPFSGYVTSGSTKMYFLVPISLNGDEIITVNEMKVTARSITGQYIEAVYNVGFDALSLPYTLTITKFPKIGIFVGIEKTSAFVYNGTSTSVLNNSPIVVTPKMNITIS